jgi:hypothetical protein
MDFPGENVEKVDRYILKGGSWLIWPFLPLV